MAVGSDDIRDGRGAAYGDIDNDGDLDIVMNTNPGDCGHETMPPLVLRNEIGQKRNWLAVEVVGTRCNRDAIGAEVYVSCSRGAGLKPFQAMRHVNVGSGYASQNSHRLQFGLGDGDPVVTSLGVRWPGSTSLETFENVPANHWVRIVEGAGLEFFDPRAASASRGNLMSVAPVRRVR
jgi:enediyne biosynthesis protein E4